MLFLSLAYQATNSGTFTLLVSSYGVGESGTYRSEERRVGKECRLRAGAEGGQKNNGADHTGAITLGDLDLWTFSASAGDYINLRIGTANFYATLVLYETDAELVQP